METINSINGLHQLRLKIISTYITKSKGYLFKFPQLSDEENNRYTVYMNSYRKKVHPHITGFITYAGLMFAIVYYFVFKIPFIKVWYQEYFSIAGIVITVVVLSRLFTMLKARWKMLTLISSIIEKTSTK